MPDGGDGVPRRGRDAWPRRSAIPLALCAIALHAGCLQAASQTCGNGSVCPPGKLCVDTENTTPDRVCAAGTCGNGLPDDNERCDDGNNRSGDGCPADCSQPCGDGVRDPGELCDDGNIVDGDGCSADCAAHDGIFSVKPPMVMLMANEGDQAPPPFSVLIQFQYRGDSVLAGFVDGVPQPTWLSVEPGPSTATTAEVTLHALGTSSAGRHSTTVRLLISHERSTGLDTFDLRVDYHVIASDLAIEATPPALAFTASVDDVVTPTYPVTVSFNGDEVTVESAPSWVTVTPAPGTSPASFTVAVNTTSFPGGTNLAGDIVFHTARGSAERRASVHVIYSISGPPALAIEALPATLAFTAASGEALPPSQPVSVTFTGATVAAVSAPSWLATSSSDPAASPAAFAVSVNSTSFAAGTSLSGDLVLRTTRGSLQQSAVVLVSYNVVAPPEMRFVAPYVGVAGRSGTVLLRGRGFQLDRPITVSVGALAIGPLTPDSDTQITLSYPALPEGRYPVRVSDPNGIAPLNAELVVVTPPPFTYQAIDAPDHRSRLVYDAERQVMYGVNRPLQQLDRFAYADGAWSALAPHIIPQLTDIAMTPNGRSLIVLDQDAISEASLTGDPFVLVRRAMIPDPLCGAFFDQAIPANNGKIFVVIHLTDCSATGLPDALLYDVLDHSMGGGASEFHEGLAGGSADGSRIYIGDFGLPHAFEVMIFDALSNTISASVIDLDLTAITVSGNASRVILQNRFVYSRALTLTGNLPPRGVVLASRDSSRAFIYVEDTAGQRLEVYNLNGPLQSGALYPLLNTIALPDSANSGPGPHLPVTMTNSLDDGTVFISGYGKLLVVPVD